jgi:alanine dehydrogenase
MKLGTDILWLSEKDVDSLLTMKETLKVMEEAFALHGHGEVQMPVKVYLDFVPYGGDLRAMPAYVKGKKPAAGVKIVNSNAKNPARGLPAVSGIMVLNDPHTGLPLGVFAAGHLTSMRTGAAGGLAARHLARPNSSTVGLVGCGRQARTQLEALLVNFKIKKVLVWGKTFEEAQAFTSLLKKTVKVSLIPCRTVQEACDADIIVTTTPVREPVVSADWVKPGTHINAIGADAAGKQELDPVLLQKSRVFVDAWEQASHAGEINVEVTRGTFSREMLAAELGEVVCKSKPGRLSADDITIFDSTGLALQDVATGRYLFHKAVKLKKGKVLKFNG